MVYMTFPLFQIFLFWNLHVSVPISTIYHCVLWHNKASWSLQLFNYIYSSPLQMPSNTGYFHWNLVLSMRSSWYFTACNHENAFHFCFLRISHLNSHSSCATFSWSHQGFFGTNLEMKREYFQTLKITSYL